MMSGGQFPTRNKEKQERLIAEPLPPPSSPPQTCNERIDQLSKPNKWLVLSLWQEYRKNFNPQRRETFRQLLQELFALTPEETEKYFAELHEVSKRRTLQTKQQKRSLKKYQKILRKRARNKAYAKFRKLLKRGIMYANIHKLPPIVTPRLRMLANIVLQHICDLRNVEVPDRGSTDKLSVFFINVADWIAICIQHVYFEVQKQKNKELDEIEKEAREMRNKQNIEDTSKLKEDTLTDYSVADLANTLSGTE